METCNSTKKTPNSLTCESQWPCLEPVTKFIFEKDPEQLENFIKNLTPDDITALVDARNEVVVVEVLKVILERILDKRLPANLFSSLTGTKGFPNYIISRRSFSL